MQASNHQDCAPQLSGKIPLQLRIALISLLLGATSVLAQNFPSKPVRIIVPFATGASGDTVSRIIGPKLGEALGQSIVVDNRPGGGGVVGAEVVAKSAPDGYTMLLGSPGPLALNPHLMPNIPYDATRDFSPVILIAMVPSILLVTPALPVKSVKELIALAKARPGQLNYASTGSGSAPHLAGELFKLLTHTDIVHIPYRGSGAANTDLIAGQVMVMFDNISSGLPYAKSGRLRGLAVTGSKRSALIPSLPTMVEAGVPGYEAGSWNALVVPAGTPKEIITRLNAEIVKVLSIPEVRERITGLGTEVVGGTPEQLGAFLQQEYAKWGRTIKSAGIKLE
jgi:tripartite-type tricarboxylate transporter receptor subunit TctC